MKSLPPWLKAVFLFFLLPNIAFAGFPADSLPTDRGALRGGAGAPGDLMLWWDVPIRWLPGVALTWKPTYLERDNQHLTWTLENPPAGMVINASTGTITWPTPIAGTYSNIKVKATRASCDSAKFPGCSLTAEQVFTLTVGTADSLIVAVGGSDSNPCTLASPCATINHAASLISGTNGKTIWVRNGTSTESWPQGSNGLFDGQSFPSNDYAEIKNFPGEHRIINAAAASGIPTSDTCAHVVIDGMEVENSTAFERGNFVLRGNHVILKDSYSHGANWDADNNTAGVNISAKDGVVIRTVSHSTSAASGNQNNVSNFLIYNDQPNSDRFLINVKGWDSRFNIKIKHTNGTDSRAIIQNTECHGVTYGCFIGYGRRSSFRHGVLYNDPGQGIFLGLTDPGGGQVDQEMLIDHNTIIPSSTSNQCIGVQSDYGETGPIEITCNICHQVNGACGGGRADAANARKTFAGWIDTAVGTAKGYPSRIDYNNWFNSSSASLTNCFELGGSSGLYNYSAWKAETGTPVTRDVHGITADSAFGNLGLGNLDIQDTSPSATNCGPCGYCGALFPEQDYSNFGQSNTVLQVWDQGAEAATPTPTPTGTPTGTPTATGTPTPEPTDTPTPGPTPTPLPPGECPGKCSFSGFQSHAHSYFKNPANVFTLHIRDECTCEGRTDLTPTTPGLYVTVRPNLTSTPIIYHADLGHIQPIGTPGIFVAPSAGKIRFGGIGGGEYELQLDRRFFAIPKERSVDVCVGGAQQIPGETCMKIFVSEAQ